ncbi:hypothetical protein P7C70_g6895, partial [Phenoliferia sp. Uapishka_3]
MWVSGAWEFEEGGSLSIGDDVQSKGWIESVVEKKGKDGREGLYVTAQREVRRAPGDSASLKEWRTHLYRPPLAMGDDLVKAGEIKAPTISPPSTSTTPTSNSNPRTPRREFADFVLPFLPTPSMLFRFSALTFNTHRIHWDIKYCLEVEKRLGSSAPSPPQHLRTSFDS